MMRITAFLFALTLAILPLREAEAQSAEDAAAIEQVIQGQLDAMQDDDWDLAFTFASPTIQGIFRNPSNFSEMVKRGYPMVWRPREVVVGELIPTGRGLVQTMLFEDQDGRFFVADYYMAMIEGEWRIDGVQIRPASQGSA